MNVTTKFKSEGMVEFPHSRSDDIPVHDQEGIVVTITGGVKVRGKQKLKKPVPFHMRFLAMSETTHVKIPLVKHQAIDGSYYAEVDIAFNTMRGRKPVIIQIDPWGRIKKEEKLGKIVRSPSSTPPSPLPPTENGNK